MSLHLCARQVFGLFDGTSELTSFRDRAIGATTLEGIDASGYAKNYVAMTSLLALSFFAAFLFSSGLDRALRKRIDPALVAGELRGLQRLVEISIVLFAMRIVLRDDFLATISSVVFFLIAVVFAVILARIRLHRRGQADTIPGRLLADSRLVIVFFALPLPLPFAFWVLFDRPFDPGGLPTAAWLAAWAGAAGLAFALAGAALRKRGTVPEDFGSRLLATALPLLALPASIPLANELQYNFPDVSARAVSLSAMAVLTAASAALFWLGRRGIVKPPASKLLDFVGFPLFVATAALYKVHRHTIALGELDYFHTGEFVLPAHQFFSFSSLPLIDLRLAHTLSDFFYPALYAAFSGHDGMDVLIWRAWIPAVVTAVLVYFFLARLVSPVFALAATCLVPVLGAVTPYYSFALVPPLALCGAVRRPTVARFALVWASAVGLALWRFDFGLVAGVALFLVISAYLVRNPARIRVVLVSLAIVAALAVGLFFAAALASQRPAVESLVFLVKSYTFRLATRTREVLFEEYSTVAALQYYLLPVVSLAAILCFAVRRLARARYFSAGQYMIVFLSIFSLVMSVRSLERHSLVEGFNPYLFVFLLALLPFLFRRLGTGRESPTARMVFYGVLVTNAFFSLPPSSYAASDLAHLFDRGKIFEFRNWNEDSQRVFYDTERHEDLVRFLTDQLREGETFFDFTNSPLLYVLADKEFPTYVIPNIIQTSETIQEDVLEDLAALRSEGRLPFVVFKQGNEFWDNVDEVHNEVRSYRIAEFVYRYYSPFAEIGSYQVWGERSSEDAGAWIDFYGERHELTPSLEPRTFGMEWLSEKEPRTFRTGPRDPYVTSLFHVDDLPPLEAYPHWRLEVRYRSSVSGLLQVFFRTDEGELDESASRWTEILASPDGAWEVVSLTLPADLPGSRLADLRFDPPEDSEITLGSVTLVGSDMALRPLSPADLSQNFQLRELPYLWGTYDPLEAASETRILAELLEDPTFLEPGEDLTIPIEASAGGREAGYLYLRVQAAEPRFDDSEIRMSLGYGERVRGSFEFALRPDSRRNYDVYDAPVREAEKTHEVESFPVGERTIYEAQGGDPYLHQLLDLEGLAPFEGEEHVYFVLRYRSSSAGRLETFFGFDSYWFRPEDTVTFEIEETSEHGEPHQVIVPVPVRGRRLTDVRFDFPAGGLFEVVGVEFARRKRDHSDYLVRMSTQWAWVSQDVSELVLRASGPVTLEKATLREAD